jgi:hypothetical protein
MIFKNLKLAAVSRASHGMLVLQKYSPEILLGAGIVGVVGATVLACHATLKAKDKIDYAKAELKTIEFDGTAESENIDQIRTMIVVTTTMDVVKDFAPAVILGTVSIGALVHSRNILSRRNAGLVAAYKAVDEAYKKYRERIKNEFGEEVDEYVRRRKPLDKEMKIVDEKGEPVSFEEAIELTPEEQDMVTFGVSQYAKFFDDSSPQWRGNDNGQNLFFLQAVQTSFNVKLTIEGIVFLNEVYDALGIPRTQAGQVVGWVKDYGDDVIDFGIYNVLNDYNADFINGYNREHILLDFNVDGWVWDKI